MNSMPKYCCYAAYADNGHSDDCPTNGSLVLPPYVRALTEDDVRRIVREELAKRETPEGPLQNAHGEYE